MAKAAIRPAVIKLRLIILFLLPENTRAECTARLITRYEH
jgi:hypothetical protein